MITLTLYDQQYTSRPTVALLEPKSENLHIYSKFELPRLGIVLLATILLQAGYPVKAYYMSKKNILQQEIVADIIGISTITTTAPAAYQLAEHYRAQNKIVILGGPHVSMLPLEAMEYADYCLCGEAEESLPQLLHAVYTHQSVDSIPGLVYRGSMGEIHRNPSALPIFDLDTLPYPNFHLLKMEVDHMGAKRDKSFTIPIQTSRGCPFDCTFCSVTAMFGHKFRFRSTEHILRELAQYDPHKHRIFFYDDNFTANPARTKALLRAMIQQNLTFRWSTQVRVDVAKDRELLDLMVKSGCETLYIGIESVDPLALKEMAKQQTVEDIKRAIREIRKRKIHIHGMFVFGFDNDTKRGLRASVNFAIRQKIDSIQFLILTPLPGTKFYYQMEQEQRILDRNWEEYDAHHVKFMPLHLTPLELQMAQYFAHARFYAIPLVILRLLYGRTQAFLIGVYANFLNKQWMHRIRPFLQKLKLISQDKPKVDRILSIRANESV